MIHSYYLNNVDETDALGRKIGAQLRGGEVIELVSDLGGGKTTLAKGIVAGAGSTDRVSSPTFTVTKQYVVPQHANSQLNLIVHADLYRLQKPGLMMHELQDIVDDPSAALIIEWADAVSDVLPKDRMTIRLSASSELTRDVTVQCSQRLGYLLEGTQ